MRVDQVEIKIGGDYFLQPLKSEEAVHGSVSADLKSWSPVALYAETDLAGPIAAKGPIRYLRLDRCSDRIREVCGSWRGRALERSKWRLSNLFATYHSAPAVSAWSLRVELKEVPAGAYLAVPIYGACGTELAYAAARTENGYLGAPRRSPSYPSNTWECPVRAADGNCSYFFPLTPELAGLRIDLVVLALRGAEVEAISPEASLTAYPPPYTARPLELCTS